MVTESYICIVNLAVEAYRSLISATTDCS